MSIALSFLKQQLGLGIYRDYSFSLSRLKCFTEDVYRGIAPNENAPDFNPEPPVFACRFSNTPGYENIIALANEDGKIALQDTTKKNGSDQPLQGSQAHNNAIFDICWMPGDTKLVTASGDHTARLWDVSMDGITELGCYSAHLRSIKSAIFRPNDKAVFATGARDGAIMIWDIRANHVSTDGVSKPKPDNVILQAHFSSGKTPSRVRRTPSSASKFSKEQSVTALAFQSEYCLLSASANDGMIKVWDLRKNYSTYKREPMAKNVINHGGKSGRNGYTSLLANSSGTRLFASCMDHTIYAYNLNSYSSEPVADYYGHENRTFYVKACLSPDEDYLASGSSDENAYIWKINEPGKPMFKLTGHTDEVTCIAWCNVGEHKIVTCSDDACHRIWRVDTQEMTEERTFHLKGTAERITEVTLDHRLESTSKLETTPTMSRAYLSYSSGSDMTPGTITPNNTVGSSSKRSYSQAFATPSNNYKSILSPIVENCEGSAKRPHTESRGARRLFSPSRKDDRHTLGCTVTPCNDEPGPSSVEKNPPDSALTFSPTMNLPNFVLDGTAPHLLERSPHKSKENVDWLTQIRKERYSSLRKNTREKSASPSNNKRRRSLSMETSRRMSKEPASPLLRFFKTAVKHADKA